MPTTPPETPYVALALAYLAGAADARSGRPVRAIAGEEGDAYLRAYLENRPGDRRPGAVS